MKFKMRAIAPYSNRSSSVSSTSTSTSTTSTTSPSAFVAGARQQQQPPPHQHQQSTSENDVRALWHCMVDLQRRYACYRSARMSAAADNEVPFCEPRMFHSPSIMFFFAEFQYLPNSNRFFFSPVQSLILSSPAKIEFIELTSR
jgi:hypothetical protein